MRINTNIMGMFAYRNYNKAMNALAKSAQRLSSGYRINSAADDPAGLAISEKMRAQIRGLNMASRNCQDAISLIQSAEGNMQTAHDILQRMREISVQASSDTNQTIDREALNAEYKELMEELKDIGKFKYNGKNLFDGSCETNPLVIQTGANSGDTMELGIPEFSLDSLGLDENADNLLDHEEASKCLEKVEKALQKVSTWRAGLGAKHNRLEHKISNLDNTAENLAAAESRIRDVDIAKEMMEYTKQMILMQASMAMMAQSNSMQEMVLQLLKF